MRGQLGGHYDGWGFYNPPPRPPSRSSIDSQIRNARCWKRKAGVWRLLSALLSGIMVYVFAVSGPMYNDYTGAELVAFGGVILFAIGLAGFCMLSVYIFFVNMNLRRLKRLKRSW